MNGSRFRHFAVALAPLLLVGCDDGGGTGPNGLLSPDEVQGSYSICSLTFTPDASFLDAVDIRNAAFELDNPPTPPRIGLDSNLTFELDYTPEGGNTDRELTGSFELGSNTILLTFAGGVDPSSLLLPSQLLVSYQGSPEQISTQASSAFDVDREIYADLAAIPEEERDALSENIRGRVAIRAATGGCI